MVTDGIRKAVAAQFDPQIAALRTPRLTFDTACCVRERVGHALARRLAMEGVSSPLRPAQAVLLDGGGMWISLPCGVPSIGGWGDLQDSADRLDPETGTMLVHKPQPTHDPHGEPCKSLRGEGEPGLLVQCRPRNACGDERLLRILPPCEVLGSERGEPGAEHRIAVSSVICCRATRSAATDTRGFGRAGITSGKPSSARNGTVGPNGGEPSRRATSTMSEVRCASAPLTLQRP